MHVPEIAHPAKAVDRYRPRSSTGSGLYAHVVDIIGQEIINGELPVGTIVFAEQLCERLGVSRSVVRESIRTLGSMGLVEARPQVGTRVQPQSNWDLLNPHVVKWRGQGPDYVLQMKQLLEVRLGIEQAAARLAAERIAPENAQKILEMALLMRTALAAGDRREFFDADVMFHRLLLEGTDNAVMAQLADTVGATLDVRGGDPRPGMHDISTESVEHHIKLAEAIVKGDSKRAQEQALLLVEGTLHEFANIPPTR